MLSDKDIMDAHFDKRLRDFVHTSFPAEITRIVNAGVVDVRPLIATKRPDGQIKQYPELFDVRIQTYACQNGSVFISLPYAVGDKVWVFVSERDTAALMQLDRVEPTTTITHDLSDCFCVPMFFIDNNIPNYSTTDLVIANKTTTITLSGDSVSISTSGECQLNASSVSIDAPNTKVMGKVGFNGKDALNPPTITGSKGGNAALAMLLTELQKYGLIIDATT
jgi:hypothetical protein